MCGEANGGSYFGSVGGRISVVVLGLLESILSIEKAISAGKRALTFVYRNSQKSRPKCTGTWWLLIDFDMGSFIIDIGVWRYRIDTVTQKRQYADEL